MSSVRVPDPPVDISGLALDLETWPPGKPIIRVFRDVYQPTAFNPGKGVGRFHPIFSKRGKPIPVLYAALTIEGAVMETIFRATPTNAVPRFVPRALVEQFCCVSLVARRELSVLPLAGNNLRRLGLVRAHLLEPGPEHYPSTARWSQAIHRARPDTAGLSWNSRQFDGSVCVMIFGDRIRQRDLQITDEPTCFASAKGFRLAASIAHRAGITITEH